jgi:hypothetical protein
MIYVNRLMSFLLTLAAGVSLGIVLALRGVHAWDESVAWFVNLPEVVYWIAVPVLLALASLFRANGVTAGDRQRSDDEFERQIKP